MVLYWGRYLGILAHLFAIWFSIDDFRTNSGSYKDWVYLVANPVIIGLSEYVYWDKGADAVKYIDPEWTQSDSASILPFKV